jgi:LiaF transmembrane domain
MIRGRVFWGLVILLVGVLLLLDTLGYLGGINIWGLIWPLFLIALGGWILWNYSTRGSRQVEHIAIPVEDAQRARIRFLHGAGRIDIIAGTSQEALIEGDFGGGLDISKNQNGEELEIRLKMPGSIFPFDWSPGQTLDWSARLKRDIPLALSLETGASESHLDLRDLSVTELNLKSGASSTSLTLPSNAGMTKVDIDAGAASIKLTVPEGVAARIRTTGGLSNVGVSDRFPRIGSMYQSPDYESAANKVDMDIEMGVGSVSIS